MRTAAEEVGAESLRVVGCQRRREEAGMGKGRGREWERPLMIRQQRGVIGGAPPRAGGRSWHIEA